MKVSQYIRCFLQQRLAQVMLFMVATLLALPSLAIEVVAHTGVTVQSLPINSARSMFGMRQLSWPDGQQVRVFVFPDRHPLHTDFCKEVLNMYPYQLRQSWDRLIYSGMGQAPIEVNSEEEMLMLVARTPGAIGYVRKANTNAVRIISIR